MFPSVPTGRKGRHTCYNRAHLCLGAAFALAAKLSPLPDIRAPPHRLHTPEGQPEATAGAAVAADWKKA